MGGPPTGFNYYSFSNVLIRKLEEHQIQSQVALTPRQIGDALRIVENDIAAHPIIPKELLHAFTEQIARHQNLRNL